MILLDATFPRLLDQWIERYARPEWAGAHLEGWLFESTKNRRAAERRFAAAGLRARLHCAYKPLVHAVLEDIDRENLVELRLRYPVHPHALPTRFRLETYPLVTLLPGVALHYEPGSPTLVYDAHLRYRNGQRLVHRINAPNTLVQSTQNTVSLSPCAWLRLSNANGDVIADHAELAEYRLLFEAVMQTLADHHWGRQEPYFERLSIRATIPALDTEIPQATTLCTCEALHEDLYFSALEYFQRYSGRPNGSRGLQPGQIVPDIRKHEGQAHVCVSIESYPAPESNYSQAPSRSLSDYVQPLTLAESAHCLAALDGESFHATSRQGRLVRGHYCAGNGPAVLISAAQHANETSGVIGALRAAHILRETGHFALIPIENPDGYALFTDLHATHPQHMHHAARYSALGDDIAARTHAPWWEIDARRQGIERSGACLHINLHGYPAHEWTRPLSGYIPDGFEKWTLPKGFFLILRHHPGWEYRAQAFAHAVTLRLARAFPELLAFNAAQLAAYRHYAPIDTTEHTLLNGLPISISVDEHPLTPITLVTEFPDETIAGSDYIFAHTVQMHAVLAAAAAWRDIE